jgi:phage terminase small subunit
MKLREDGIIQVKSRSLKKKKNPKLQIIDNIINSTLNMDD